jgi:hypothetical protein
VENAKPQPKRKEFEQFRDFTKRVMSVPKREIDKREDAYRVERTKRAKKRELFS